MIGQEEPAQTSSPPQLLYNTWQYSRGARMVRPAAKSKRRHNLKIIVEKHRNGYVAYPLGLKGVVVGEGDSYDDALADVKSAIRFHIKAFGREVLRDETPILEAFIAEASVP
jgi:predicted RNase H-like HicB family nuclease